MKKSKAYLIDPFKKEVSEIVIGTYMDINSFIGDTFCLGPRLKDRDVIYLDDNGIFKENQEWFMTKGYPQPFAGYGVVLGSDEEGESVSVKAKIEDIIDMTTYVSRELVQKLMDNTDIFTPKVISFKTDEEFFDYLQGNK